MKTCSRCKADLPLSEFRANASQASGRQSYCRTCQIEHNRNRAEKAEAQRDALTEALRDIVHTEGGDEKALARGALAEAGLE